MRRKGYAKAVRVGTAGDGGEGSIVNVCTCVRTVFSYGSDFNLLGSWLCPFF